MIKLTYSFLNFFQKKQWAVYLVVLLASLYLGIGGILGFLSIYYFLLSVSIIRVRMVNQLKLLLILASFPLVFVHKDFFIVIHALSFMVNFYHLTAFCVSRFSIQLDSSKPYHLIDRIIYFIILFNPLMIKKSGKEILAIIDNVQHDSDFP